MSCFAIATLFGCTTRCPDFSTALPLEQVTRTYNANAARIPQLWARAEVSATFRQKPGDIGFPWRSSEPNGLLILQKNSNSESPQDFVLIIKETGRELGRVGVDTKTGVYYTWFLLGDNQNCQWGHLDLAGAPDINEMPIDPLQLLSVLSVCQLPPDQTKPPLVAQSVSVDPCAYVLTLIDKHSSS